jgi:hypothetical protein
MTVVHGESPGTGAPRHQLREALIAALVFGALHLLLAACNFHLLDPEELESGNLAVAWLDGAVVDATSFRARMPREGALILIAPLIAPFFAVLGPHMWALRLFNVVFAAICAAIWYLIGRTAAPAVPRWLVFGLSVMPLPLMQRTATNVTCVGTHLGTSTWLGIAILLTLEAGRRSGRGRWLLLAGAGLFSGIATYWSYSFLPLLPGLLWLIGRTLGRRGLLVWACVVAPFAVAQLPWAQPLAILTSSDPIGALTALPLGTQERLGGLTSPFHNLFVLLVYGPGFSVPQIQDWAYLPLGPLWTGPFTWLAIRSSRLHPPVRPADGPVAPLRQAVWLALAGYAAALVFTGFRIDWDYSSGLRYLYPITSLITVALIMVLPRGTGSQRGLGGWFLALHALGYLLMMRTEVFPAPWHLFQGYEAATPFQRFNGELRTDSIDPGRLPRYALWAGSRYAPDLGVEPPGDWRAWEPVGERYRLREPARSEFWRGVGLSQALNGGCLPARTCGIDGAPSDISASVWEGVAMGTCCEDNGSLLALAGEGFREAAWYGIGRRALMCHFWGEDVAKGEDHHAFERGVRDAWERDNWSGLGEVDSASYLRQIAPMTIYGPEDPLPWFRDVLGLAGNPTHCRQGGGELIEKPR